MNQAFRFPILNKLEKKQSLVERLDAAERIGWQKGYEEGLEQGALNQQSVSQEEIKQQVQEQLADRVEAEKKLLVERFNILFEKVNSEIAALSSDLKSDITLMITRLAEHVIDAELKTAPELRIEVVEKAMQLLSDRDIVTQIAFSSADKEWLEPKSLEGFSVPVSFDDELVSGDVELIAEKQTHTFSFSQRLQGLIDEIAPEILRPDNNE